MADNNDHVFGFSTRTLHAGQKPDAATNARAVPIAIDGETLVVALADPLDRFTPSAIAAAVDMSVRLEVAVPIELDAALKNISTEALKPT